MFAAFNDLRISLPPSLILTLCGTSLEAALNCAEHFDAFKDFVTQKPDPNDVSIADAVKLSYQQNLANGKLALPAILQFCGQT